jgi:high-affinity iron transporter
MQRTAQFISLLCLAVALPVHADPARLAQLVDYVGVDYAVAVEDGKVISEAEYSEMLEFAGLIEAQVEDLPRGRTRDGLRLLAADLAAAIEAKADPARVADLAFEMTELLLASPTLVTAPANTPELATAATVYLEQCATCHGAEGTGNGPAAHAAMEPAPTDFTDPARARARSLYGLYNTITLGVEGTAMTSYGHLSADERWALAFYVGSLHLDADTRHTGERLFAETPATELPDLGKLTTTTLDSVAESQGDAAASLHAWLRANPQALAEARPDPLVAAVSGIRRSLDLYADGDAAAAHDAAVDAYLEGFELAEASLRTTQPELVARVETAMMDLRQSMRRQLPLADVRAAGASGKGIGIFV